MGNLEDCIIEKIQNCFHDILISLLNLLKVQNQEKNIAYLFGHPYLVIHSRITI